MAKKKKQGTIAKAQARFVRAMRAYEQTVSEVMGFSEKPKAKKKAKRTKKAKARGRKKAVQD